MYQHQSWTGLGTTDLRRIAHRFSDAFTRAAWVNIPREHSVGWKHMIGGDSRDKNFCGRAFIHKRDLAELRSFPIATT